MDMAELTAILDKRINAEHLKMHDIRLKNTEKLCASARVEAYLDIALVILADKMKQTVSKG